MSKATRRMLCLLLVFLLLFSSISVMASFAEQKAETSVIETNIGIQPFDYKRMISTNTEKSYSVKVETDGGKPHSARIHIRGNGTKEVGMQLPTKRLPIELTFENAEDYSETIANSCAKICNVITPFELMAQHIAYDMFAYLDIPVPAHAFSFIQYNDVDFGVFFVLEEINEEFLAKHFSQQYGSLYKSSGGNNRFSFVYSRWFGGLRIVIDQGSERFLALLEALDRGKGYEEYLDMDEAMRFFACTAAYGGASSLLSEQNNYFLFDTGDKFIFLPWDLSEAFSAEPTDNGVDRFRLGSGEDTTPSELFDLLMRDNANRKLYHEYLRQICEGFLAPDTLDAHFQSLVSVVSPYLQRDCTICCTWEQKPENVPDLPVTFRSLLSILHAIHENLMAQLDGTEDTFFVDPAYAYIEQEIGDTLAYAVKNTSTMNRHITDDICKGYTSYCRRRGITRFATGDPMETAAAFSVFFVVFCVLFLSVRRPSKKNHRQKRRPEPENRRC